MKVQEIIGGNLNESAKHWKDSNGKKIGLGDKVTIKFKGGEQSYTIKKPGAEMHTLYAVNDKTGNEIHAPAASFTLIE
jgi:hypothetical protein